VNILEGSLLGGGSDLGPLSALLLDLVEGGTNDGPLDLHDLPRLLLLDFLRGTLLVDTPVDLRPLDLTGVALVEESLLDLGADEHEGLHVGTGIATAMTGVDLVARELADFGPKGCEDGGIRSAYGPSFSCQPLHKRPQGHTAQGGARTSFCSIQKDQPLRG
jgi:hypothetical protein